MEETSNGFAIVVIALIVIAMGAVWWNTVRDRKDVDWATLVVTKPSAREAEAKVLEVARLVAAQHARALYIKSRQLITEDAYGNRDATGFYREIDYFIGEVLTRDEQFREIVRANRDIAVPLAHSICGDGQGTLRHKVGEEITGIVATYRFINDKIEPDLEAVSPIEFEILCAQKMENAGWDAELTKASGDQGADVICRKDGISIVLQCKLYSAPIGNKAVQEAFAARSYYGLDHAAVVSNQPYTKSATELANMTGVLLLDFHDLGGIDARLGLDGPA